MKYFFIFLKKIIIICLFLGFFSFSVILFFLWKYTPELPSYEELRNYNPNLSSRVFTSDGILAVGGRDSSSNSAIIRKYMEKDDKVFHAEIHGSPFFILKDKNETIMPLSIRETSHATVCFSRAWKEGMYGVNCYWVTPEQVKRLHQVGKQWVKALS